MSKVKGYLRRFLACVMICFTLSFTAAGDYLGVQAIQVQATGVIELGLLKALIEAIMLSMGLSYSSQADLDLAAQGLSSIMKQYTDYEVGGVKIFPLITESIVNGGAGATSWCIPVVADQWLRDYLYSTCVPVMSSACDVVDPITSDSNFDSFVRISFSDCTASELISVISMDNSVYYVDGDDVQHDVSLSAGIMSARYIVTQLVQNDTYAELYVYYVPSSCDYPIIYNDDGCSYMRYSGDVVTDNSMEMLSCDAAYVVAYDSSYYASNKLFRSKFIYDYTDKYFHVPSNYINTSTYAVKSFYYNSTKSSSPIYCAAPLSNETDTFRVIFNSDFATPVYSSYEEFSINSYASIYAPTSKVYGLSASAKPFEKDDTTGTVSVPLDNTGITQRVEKAVSTAMAANPSITEEELNAAASDVIAAQNGTTEAVNQNTATLSALLTSILATVRSIADNVAKLSVDGGAGALDWSDVQDAFGTTTIEPDVNDNDNDDDGGKPNIWIPGVVAGVSILLKPLIEFLGEPLSVVTQFQSAILGQLEGAQEWIMDIPEAISVALNPALTDILEGVLSLPVTGIYEGILALPGDIADALSNGLSIDIPDVVFPDLDIIDYTSLLDRIIELLESFFLLDTAAIAAALGGFEKVWEEKLPFGSKLFALFNEFYFSPNYNYPVIKIKTPDIIRTFYLEEYIILCDFEEYKVYCLWARNIIKAWLWFCFGLSIFSHLRTNFHIG